MNKGKKLYEGKAKILYEGPEKGTAIQHFKDDATAFNNLKKATVEGKGVLNNRISEHILNNINQIGIKTHLIKRLKLAKNVDKIVLATTKKSMALLCLLSRPYPVFASGLVLTPR